MASGGTSEKEDLVSRLLKELDEKNRKLEEEKKKLTKDNEQLEEEKKKLKEKNKQLEEKQRQLEDSETDSPEAKKNKRTHKEKCSKLKNDGWTRKPPNAHKGFDFEMNLIALLFLRCLRSCKTFALTGGIQNFNPFEDILLEYSFNNNYCTYLMQLKHKTVKSVTSKDLHDKGKDFDLEKYSKGYCKLKETAAVTENQFNNSFPDWNFVLFTNCPLENCQDHTIEEDIADEPRVLSFEGGTIHRIQKGKCQKEACVNMEPEFLKKFRLHAQQPSVEELDRLIMNEIAMKHSECYFANYIALHFMKNIRKWFGNAKDNLNNQSKLLEEALTGKTVLQVELHKLLYRSGRDNA